MEIKKILLCMGGLIFAVGGPISMYSTIDLVGSIKRSWAAGTSTASFQQLESVPGYTESASPSDQAPPTPSIATLNPTTYSTPTTSLADVLRFDVTVEWVLQRWPRVLTGLSHLQLQGYRVPVVTGASATDLAGSLTYYFNAMQQAQRITLRGTTGDPSELVAIVTGRFHFARRLTNDPGLVLYEAVDPKSQPVGSLKIRSARVIQANRPFTRFEIEFEMNRPN